MGYNLPQGSSRKSESSNDRGFVSLPIIHAPHTGSIVKRDSEVQLFNISTVSYLVERK